MVSGRADPERDGVADYARHLTAALRDLGEEVVPVPVLGPREAAERLHALKPDLAHVQFAPSAFGFSARPGLLPDMVRGLPFVTTLHEYGWWSSPRWLPGGGVAAAGAGPPVGPRDLALRPPQQRRAHHQRRPLPRAARPVRPHGRPGPARAERPRSGTKRSRPRRAAGSACPPTPRSSPSSGSCTRSRACATSSRRWPGCAARDRSGRPPAPDHRRDRLHLLILGGFTSLALPEHEARAFREELTAWTQTCGVARHVTITGHLPAAEVSAALHAADLAAFPFTAGATTKSGALLSAFAHGLPTLVTAADPPDPDLVDGTSVVVAPRVRDALVLVDGLARLLDDEPLRRKVAAGGAALMAGRSWEEIAATHRAVYTEVLRGRERDA